MSVPRQQALEWFSAIGPTVATFAAVGATVWSTVVARRVSRDAAELQKRMSGPRLTIAERTQMTPNSWREWAVDLRNDGQTVGSVEEIKVLVDGEPYGGSPLGDGPVYWQTVFEAIDLGPCGYINACPLAPCIAVSPGSPLNLFTVLTMGTSEQIERAVRRIRIEVAYASVWGERFTLNHEFGRL